ncbi:phage major capsid protein [Galbibacter sp. BG1]|uniref:phage major capsid protein n=1 Tax=Galbibacter sp. BG1 TaxID=1170699 RepID=UPI0015BE63A7|nr:phage major capsid protein [Galbibacter sp. BG1]QLE02889.1 phage major capsid protein [Galbibacter sp. BG1]
MKKSDALKKQRASKLKEWEDLVNGAETENRSLNVDEETKITEIRNELASLDTRIENAIDLESRQADAARFAGGQSQMDGEEAEKSKVKERFSLTKMLRNSLEGTPLEGAEKEAQEIAEQENRNAGVSFAQAPGKTRIMVPLSFIRASQQTVSQDGGEYGGELVVNQAPRVVDGLEPKLFVEELGATMLTGLSGGDIPLPVANSYAFEWLAEGANITPQKKKFVGATLSPKRAGAAVSMSNRLLMQSSLDVEGLVRRKLSQGWANAINGAAINGAGGNAPTGILNTSGVNQAADTAAAAATFAKIVELQGLIEEDNATEINLAYLLSPKLKAALKTKSKDSGSGRFIIEGNELDGYRFVSTSLVPTGDDGGTPVYPLIYGDFSQLYIGQWGAVSFLANPYSEDLADSVRITVNTHADVQIANPQAFAVNGFLTNA